MFLWIMQWFVPVLGSFFILVAVYYLKNYRHATYPVEIVPFHNPIYIRKDSVQVESYAEGWAAIRLERSSFPAEERKQALITVSRGAKQNVNRLYNQLVSDDMEELRICAFSLLENQQNFLHEKINELLKIYSKTLQDANKAYCAKQLAFLYWELIYLNLGEKEFRKIILGKSKYYAEMAHLFYKNDPFILVLLARIHMTQGRLEQGINLLCEAVQCHAPNSKIYPYFAELAFAKKDYEAVRQYLADDKSFTAIFKIRPLVTFWCRNDSIPR